ncbi:nucleotidyltransferase substrate binding protein [Negadavirga shengliensis]|uniref:Nucleotidyltransferase substrate binding protein n=1 Tax=Negadavirga shengliensis TaxID=1389218 RepID=A0ABV9T379_9BACT
MTKPEINCEKCFGDFKESLAELKDLIQEGKSRGMNDKLKAKMVRSFELTHDLAINTIGEYFKKQGRPPFSGSRDATVEAFNEDLIDNGQGWLDMIIFRIKYNPLYPGDYLEALTESILVKFVHLLENFEAHMERKLEEDL